MIIRDLKRDQYRAFCQALQDRAISNPLDPSYTVPLFVNGTEYRVRIQPAEHDRVAVLYALRVFHEEEYLSYDLITTSPLLTAFLELLLAQGIPNPRP